MGCEKPGLSTLSRDIAGGGQTFNPSSLRTSLGRKFLAKPAPEVLGPLSLLIEAARLVSEMPRTFDFEVL